MKKLFPFKTSSMMLVVGLFVASIGFLFAQTNVSSDGAREDVDGTVQSTLPKTKAEKIQFFEQQRDAFTQAGNTAAANYCTQALNRLN